MKGNFGSVGTDMKKYIKSAIQDVTDMDVQDQVDIAMFTDNPTILRNLAHTNCSWVVKLAIVDNANTPLEVLEHLAEDCNQTVRFAAKYNLKNRE